MWKRTKLDCIVELPPDLRGQVTRYAQTSGQPLEEAFLTLVQAGIKAASEDPGDEE